MRVAFLCREVKQTKIALFLRRSRLCIGTRSRARHQDKELTLRSAPPARLLRGPFLRPLSSSFSPHHETDRSIPPILVESVLPDIRPVRYPRVQQLTSSLTERDPAGNFAKIPHLHQSPTAPEPK